MRINNIHTKQSFTSLLISSSVTNLKPANREKINVVRDMASYMPDMDFVIESNNAGDMQITIQRAHPLDMLIACGLVQFNSKEHHFIELVKAAQQTHNYVYDVKPKTYKETIPEEANNEETAFIIEDMVDIFNETIDKPETN